MYLEKNDKIQTYLAIVTSQIKWNEVHGQVKSELLSHFEEVVLELEDSGLSQQEAVAKAIARMGDANDLGRQFQQTHVPQKNWPLVATVTLLSGLGITLMYMLESSGLLTPSLHIFMRSLIFTGLGVAVLLWLHYCDFRKVRPYTTYLYAGTMMLWLVSLLWGTSIEGKQFLTLGPVSIDSTGIIPYLLTISLAGLFTNRDWSNWQWVVKSVLLLLVPLLFCIESNNIALALMCTLIFLVLMAIAGAKKMQIIGFALIPIGMLLIKMYQDLGIFRLDYLQSANLWGHGELRVEAITGAHTDYVFRYFIQEFGWLAGIAVIMAGVVLLVVLIHSMLEIKDRFGRLTVGGLTVCFAVQISWHILMSLGLMPVISMNLPFISFGGTQTIIHLGSIGAILSIYKRKNLQSM